MENIDIQYIKQSKKIIDDHKLIMNSLEYFEKILNNNKQVLLQYKDQIEIIDNSTDEAMLKHQKISEMMDDYDASVEKMKKDIEPYIKKLEQIKKESSILYKIIKDKYPSVDDKELQQQIFKQIQEL